MNLNLSSPTDWTKLTNQYRLKKPVTLTNSHVKLEDFHVPSKGFAEPSTHQSYLEHNANLNQNRNPTEGPKSPQQFKDYLLLQKSKRQDNEIAELDLKNQELHFKLCGRETEMRGLEDGLEKAKTVAAHLETRLHVKEEESAELTSFWKTRNRQLEEQVLQLESRLMKKQQQEAHLITKSSELHSKVETFENQIQRLREEHDISRNDLIQMYEKQVKDLTETYEKRFETLHFSSNEDLSKLQRELKEEQSKQSHRFSEMTEMYEKQIISVQKMHDMNLNEHDSHLKQEIELLNEKLKTKDKCSEEMQKRVEDAQRSQHDVIALNDKRNSEIEHERLKYEDAAQEAIENLKSLLHQEKSMRKSKEDQLRKFDHLLMHNSEQHQQIINELEKQLTTLKSHIEISDSELKSVRNALESKNLKLKKFENEYDLAIDQLHRSKNETGIYTQQLHDVNLTIENLKTELHHSHRGSGRVQQEYEKIKQLYEEEREESGSTIRELRKINEKYRVEIECKNEKIQSIVSSGNHQIENQQRHVKEVAQQRDLIYSKLQEAERKILEVSQDLQEFRRRDQTSKERLVHFRNTTAPLEKYQQSISLCTQLEKELGQSRLENLSMKETIHNNRCEIRELHLNMVPLKEYDECMKRIEQSQSSAHRLTSELGESKSELDRLAQSCQSAKVAVIKAQTEIDHSRMNEQQLKHTIQDLENRNEKLNSENRHLHGKNEESENDRRRWRQKYRETSSEVQESVEKCAKIMQSLRWCKTQLLTIVNQQPVKKVRKCSHSTCAQLNGQWVRLSSSQQRKIKKYLKDVDKF